MSSQLLARGWLIILTSPGSAVQTFPSITYLACVFHVISGSSLLSLMCGSNNNAQGFFFFISTIMTVIVMLLLSVQQNACLCMSIVGIAVICSPELSKDPVLHQVCLMLGAIKKESFLKQAPFDISWCHGCTPGINLGRWQSPNRLKSNQNCLSENQLEKRFIQYYSALRQHYKIQVQITVSGSIIILHSRFKLKGSDPKTLEWWFKMHIFPLLQSEDFQEYPDSLPIRQGVSVLN